MRSAEYVVVGGGAVGCGVAWSLACAGRTDVLVLERSPEFGDGTTSQGAGLCGQVRASVDRVRLAMHSVAVFEELENDPDVRPGWQGVGSLRVAETDERVAEFERLVEASTEAGLEVDGIDVADAKRRWPALDFSETKAVLWCPTDGYMDPRSVVRSYAHQCRKLGVRFETSTGVESIEREGDRVCAVRTGHGFVNCEYVINAAGAHAYHMAKLVGLELPIVPVRHEYFVSVAFPGMRPDLPVLRLPDSALYVRADEDRLLLGGWEDVSVSTDPRDYSVGDGSPLIVPDATVLASFSERFDRFVPGVHATAYSRVAKGWPTFTPDGHFILGESSRVRGFVMAGGCNAHGISGSAGIGRLLVESLFEDEPSQYVRSLSPDRFDDWDGDWEEAARSARRVYETYYAC